jgi:hypothetical protein
MKSFGCTINLEQEPYLTPHQLRLNSELEFPGKPSVNLMPVSYPFEAALLFQQ